MAVRCSYSLLLYILLLQSLVMYLGTRAEPYVTSRAAYYRSADGLGTEGKCMHQCTQIYIITIILSFCVRGMIYVSINVTAGGACGYGFFGRNLNGGDVAAVAQLYRNGTGCGACYKVTIIIKTIS